MTPREKRSAIGEALESTADEQRLAHNWARIAERERQRALMKGRILPAIAVVAFAMGGVWGGLSLWPSINHSRNQEPVSLNLSDWTPVIAVPDDATKEKRVPLSDGSWLIIAPGAALEVKESSAERVEFVLLRGWVRFDIAPGRGRTWTVDAGLGRFVVLGTQFTVSRSARVVRIAVHRGKVALVSSPSMDKSATLSAGDARELWASDRVVTLAGAAPGPGPDAGTTEASPKSPSQAKHSPSRVKRPIGRGRKMPESPMAYLSGLGSSGPVNEWLSAADEARRRKRPAEAAALLARILKEHPEDPSVGLVALTLGRLRLGTLNQPRAAAAAFKVAMESKGLPKPLREQAFARCAEAYHLSGDNASARSVAKRYRQNYPNGAWLPWIESWVDAE